ncbi:MAG: anthranilate phosphoribosyltransferase, partial [Treponema sp.]|jgi:anthranilate phosphoribosyltransferase|nr:anthranilate phosphoribosyltransferase [Treponema sp.]
MVEPMAQVLSNLGVKNALVVYGEDGLDEISASAPTRVCEVRNGRFSSYTITPEQFGLERCKKSDIEGGSPEENARITRAILAGEPGPKRDAVLLNSAAALYVAHPDFSIMDAIGVARKTIDSGKAAMQLEQFIARSNGRLP